MPLAERFWFFKKSTLTTNQCFKCRNFTTYDKFFIPEGVFPLLKNQLTEMFSRKGKFPQLSVKKSVPTWNITKLFFKKKKASKMFKKILYKQQETKSNVKSWQKAIKDSSIEKSDIHMHSIKNITSQI